MCQTGFPRPCPENGTSACTDNKEDYLFRLATVQSSNATKENLFLEVLRVESLDKIDPRAHHRRPAPESAQPEPISR